MADADTRRKFLQTVFKLPKQKQTVFVGTCLMFVFSLFFLMPLDLYLNNLHEFNIGFIHTALPLLIVSACLVAAILLLIPLILRGIALDVVSLLFLGITGACYIQTLFFNGRMLDLAIGASHIYNEVNAYNTINYVLWTTIAILPLVIWKGLHDSGKYKNIKWEKGVIRAAIIVVGMQLAGVVAAVSNYDVESHKAHHHYPSYDKVLELSSEENIVVFLMDAFDTYLMNKALERHPILHEQLDGFTFYENNLPLYPNTFPSVAQMLTGERTRDANDSRQRQAYFERAWSKRNFIDILRENGYGSTLLLDKASTFTAYRQLSDRTDNLKEVPDFQIRLNHRKVAFFALGFSFVRAAPYYFKNIFDHDFSDFSNFFFEYASDDIIPPRIGVMSDVLLYNNLKANGIRTQNSSKTFAFMHLNYICYTGDRYVGMRKSDYTLPVRGSFDILFEYFTQMKELGIYDSSTIILVADHGSLMDRRIGTAGLLIKPKYSCGALKRDKTAELSNDNFGASVLAAAGLPHEEFGLSYFDIINGGIPQTRELIVDSRDKYEVTGDANNPDNWKPVPY